MRGKPRIVGFMSPTPSQDNAAEKPFPMPEDVKTFSGVGATDEDIRRGYLKPDIREEPKYDAENYVDRWSQPSRPDADGDSFMGADFDFRMKDRKSRGILTRPHIPDER